MLNWVSMPGKPSGGDFQPPTQLNHNSGALPELAKDALEAGSRRWRWVWAEGTAAQRARRWLCSPQVTSPGVSQRSQPPRAIRGGWHSSQTLLPAGSASLPWLHRVPKTPLETAEQSAPAIRRAPRDTEWGVPCVPRAV